MSDPTPSVIVLDPDAPAHEIERVREAATAFQPAQSIARGDGWAALALGLTADRELLERLSAVRRVVPIDAPYRIASKKVFDEATPVDLGRTDAVGGRAPIAVMAGSRWAAGSEVRLAALAPLLAEAGCGVVHIGAPFAAGSGGTVAAVRRLRDVAHEHDLALSLEVSSPAEIADAGAIADLLVVGSHNMQDFTLLRELGGCDLAVVLKRGAGATVEEFLLAAEYVLTHGNGRVILCEAGIRTFDALAKPRFEINAIALLKQLTHLPVIADPSRCAPSGAAIPALAKGAVAAGADGLLLDVGTETIHDPGGVLIGPETLQRLLAELRPIARAVGRVMPGHPGGETVPVPTTTDQVLRRTDRTLAQVLEWVIGAPPQLDVIDQWRIEPPAVPSALVPPFEPGDSILARCTGYRTGDVRLSRNLAFVNLSRIDPTLGALLASEQVNLGQLFVDPRISKLGFEFGTDLDAGDIHDTLARCFPGEDLRPYLWRRYHATIEGRVVFVVIESLPVSTWGRLLRTMAPAAAETT